MFSLEMFSINTEIGWLYCALIEYKYLKIH